MRSFIIEERGGSQGVRKTCEEVKIAMCPMKRPSTAAARGDFRGTLSLPAAARKLGVSTKTLRRRMARGEMPFVQIRGQLRVPSDVVNRRGDA